MLNSYPTLTIFGMTSTPFADWRNSFPPFTCWEKRFRAASTSELISVATYQDYTLKDFRLGYQYARGTMKLEPLGLQFSGGDAFTAEGSLNGNLQFTGEEASTIQKTLRGKAVAKLGMICPSPMVN
jgi:hypothetical protein